MDARLSARLSALSRDDLLELAIAGLAIASDAVRSAFDDLLARRHPLPARCVEGVLLSPDLLLHLMEPLALRQSVVASVCSVWASGWSALLHRRRYVHPVVVRTLPLAIREPYCLAALPEGHLCVIGSDGIGYVSPATGEILGDLASGGVGAVLPLHYAIAAQDGAIFASSWHASEGHRVVKLSQTGTVLARSPEVLTVDPLGLALDSNRLFVASGNNRVLALDPDALEELHSSGEGLLEDPFDCAVCGGELFVADVSKPGQLQVFGLDCSLRRTVRGDFHRPACLVGHEGRLYMLEARVVAGRDQAYEEACDNEKIWAGRRLIILEPDGETHQVVHLPDAGDLQGLCFHGEELFMADNNLQRMYVLPLLRQC